MRAGARAVRPAVSVVIPFRGGAARVPPLLEAVGALRSTDPCEGRDGDQVIVADNTEEGVAAGLPTTLATVVPASEERSSYHARNAGAGAAHAEWLLFMDADCFPAPGLLDAYFAEPIDERCGAVAGQILGDRSQGSLAARYARSRHLFDHAKGLIRAQDGGAAAGNLLVRRSAFEQAGGFTEGIRSGGDLDLCRRLRLEGWALGFRPQAVVHHHHREGVGSLLGAVARYGAGARWLNERYPGSSPRWPLLPGLRGAARDVNRLILERRGEEAIYRCLDALGLIAHNIGYLASNEAGRSLGCPAAICGAGRSSRRAEMIS